MGCNKPLVDRWLVGLCGGFARLSRRYCVAMHGASPTQHPVRQQPTLPVGAHFAALHSTTASAVGAKRGCAAKRGIYKYNLFSSMLSYIKLFIKPAVKLI